jgi:uncharacterized membrane protein YqhA
MIERLFQTLLWQSRWVVIAAVVASVFAALIVFFTATVDAFYMGIETLGYASPGLTPAARDALRAEMITVVIEIVDSYLLGSVLLIFALGLYELFIGKLDVAKDSAVSTNVLFISSLDELKTKLSKVILMILVVKFFEKVLKVSFAGPLDLLYLAAGIALIGLALWLTHSKTDKQEKPDAG